MCPILLATPIQKKKAAKRPHTAHGFLRLWDTKGGGSIKTHWRRDG